MLESAPVVASGGNVVIWERTAHEESARHNCWRIQISIDPLHFPAGLLDHAKRAVRVAQPVLLSHTKCHGQARSNRR